MDPLDAVAFPSPTVEEVPTAQAPQAESGTDNTESVPSPTEGVEEQRIPYSRMKAVIDARREAEQRAEEAEERLNQVLSRNEEPRRQENRNVGEYDGALPVYWAKMYGDNENSRLAYSYELERQQAIRDEVRREALNAVREERTQETQVIAGNERTIDNHLEDLSYSLGRELSEQEEDAILTIVDEYTPTDEDGKYSGSLMSFEKAWEIYNLRQSQSSGAAARSRRAPTMLTGTPTNGEPSTKLKDDKDWNPQDWNGWRKRVPN